jgi:hypothetical protein
MRRGEARLALPICVENVLEEGFRQNKRRKPEKLAPQLDLYF